MARVVKANRREVPEKMPPTAWADLVDVYVATGRWADVPWHDPALEYLTPRELMRVKAKALVWYEVTGEWPQDIVTWWEPRQARRRGEMPHTEESVSVEIDRDGVLHCGCCGARWGAPYPNRCKLCDRLLEDAPIPA